MLNSEFKPGNGWAQCLYASFVKCVLFFFFGHEACRILAPEPGIEPTTPVLEGEALSTGPPGKSLVMLLNPCEY